MVFSLTETALVYSFIIGLFAYVLCLPLYRSRKSFGDAIAARRVIGILRVLVFIETCACFTLMYFIIAVGSPIPAPYASYAMPYGASNGNSWIFSYPRPITGIVLIGLGTFGDMHPIPRILCLTGSLFQGICDGISYIFVLNYITQHNKNNASLQGNFNITAMYVYIYRDLISFAVCIWMVLLSGHLSNVIGWCEPQLITYQMIVGGQMDRCQIMREQLERKNKTNTVNSQKSFHFQEQNQSGLINSNSTFMRPNEV